MQPFLTDQLRNNVPSALVLCFFVTAIACVRSPRLKALIYSLPVPFTCAYVATGVPMNATHITGLILIVTYNWLVWFLRTKANWPLQLAIPASVGVYITGSILARPLAGTPLIWVALIFLAIWTLNALLYRARPEPHHRGRTPVYLKIPMVFVISMIIYNATRLLAGAVNTFPYAGIFTSYESRHSLRTLAGQFTINILGLLLCILTIAATENRFPAPIPLLLGWIPVILWILTVRRLGLGQVASEQPVESETT